MITAPDTPPHRPGPPASRRLSPLDLGFINIGAYNQNGSKGLTFGIFGGEVRDDYTNGQLTQTFGAHYGFGIEGIASAGVSAWSDGTFSATAAIGPVSGGLSYNVNGGGLSENLGLGLYGMPGESFSGTLGYGWSFSKNGTQGGFNVNVNASGYARDHFGSGWNSLQDAYDKFNNGFMGNWARTPNGGETLLPGGGLLNFDPGTESSARRSANCMFPSPSGTPGSKPPSSRPCSSRPSIRRLPMLVR